MVFGSAYDRGVHDTSGDCSDVFAVLLKSGTVDQDVIYIHNDLMTKHIPEDLIYECLEHRANPYSISRYS